MKDIEGPTDTVNIIGFGGYAMTLAGPIDALFSCAGVADGTPGIEKINFIGHRHLIDRVIDQGYLVPGSAIGMISPTAGLAWRLGPQPAGGYQWSA